MTDAVQLVFNQPQTEEQISNRVVPIYLPNVTDCLDYAERGRERYIERNDHLLFYWKSKTLLIAHVLQNRD